jgi:Protein of unknown function (DUF3780)
MAPVRAKRGDVGPGALALDGAFGFDPEQGAAHFLLRIPEGTHDPVEISEHLSWDPEHIGLNTHLNPERQDGQIRSRCPRAKWNDVADAVRAEFNTRLRTQGHPPGRWKVGYNPLVRVLGKELCLLLWAIEDADPALSPKALANWQGLTPEERWWLYTMTAAATGNYATGRNVGWRKAVRYAFTENPVAQRPPSERVVPEFFRLAEVLPTLHTARVDTAEAQDAASASSDIGGGFLTAQDRSEKRKRPARKRTSA